MNEPFELCRHVVPFRVIVGMFITRPGANIFIPRLMNVKYIFIYFWSHICGAKRADPLVCYYV